MYHPKLTALIMLACSPILSHSLVWDTVVILGDFNAPDICWSSLTGSDSNSNALCDFVVAKDLEQLVTFPTHCGRNILDLLFCSSPGFILNIHNTTSSLLSSDHLPIFFELDVSVRLHTRRKSCTWMYSYKKTDFEGLNSFLLDYDFSPLLNSTDIEFSWSFFRAVMLTAISMFTPMVKLKSADLPSWFTPSIRHSLHKVHSLRKRFRLQPSHFNMLRLTSAECLLQLDMHEARVRYEKRLVENFASRKDPGLFRYIRSLSGKSAIPSVVHSNSCEATSPLSIANLFNQYFHSVYNTSSFSPPDPPQSFPDNSICSIDVSPEDTFEVLTSLHTDKAMGGDGIPPIVLKKTAVAIVEPLHHIFTLCLKHSSLPTEWRNHHITPIHKSGDRSLVSNYRPISHMSCVSKIFERLVFDKISNYLIESSISNSQFGFIRNRSSVKQLLIHTKSIIEAFDNKQQLDTILLDVRKAFDTVPHNILLSKLWDMGIVGSLWKLLQSYLAGRRQCVVVDGQLSDWLPVCSGVPQGSILGPLLFLVHINDLPSFISFSSTLLFADDTKLSKAVSSTLDCSHLQQDIHALEQWSSFSGLQFNVTKSFLLRFCCHSPQQTVNYTLNNSVIPQVTTTRDLGVLFSENLSWTDHYNSLLRQAYSQLYLIKRTFSTACPLSVKKLLYTSLVRSKLTYCSQVWRPMLIKDITNLERIQRRATRYITGHSSPSYRDRLISLHLLPLMYFYEYLDILLLVQSLKFPDESFAITNYISFSSSSTRSNSTSKLSSRYCAFNRSRHFYFNCIVRLWNALPPIDLSLSLPTIKSHLKKYFWSHFLEHFDSCNPCTYNFICPCSNCHLVTPAPSLLSR